MSRNNIVLGNKLGLNMKMGGEVGVEMGILGSVLFSLGFLLRGGNNQDHLRSLLRIRRIINITKIIKLDNSGQKCLEINWKNAVVGHQLISFLKEFVHWWTTTSNKLSTDYTSRKQCNNTKTINNSSAQKSSHVLNPSKETKTSLNFYIAMQSVANRLEISCNHNFKINHQHHHQYYKILIN